MPMERMLSRVSFFSLDAFLEVEQLVLVAEELDLPHQRHQLRKDGGDGGPCIPHLKTG